MSAVLDQSSLAETVTSYVAARAAGVPAAIARAAAVEQVPEYEYGFHGHPQGRHTIMPNPQRVELNRLLDGAELAVASFVAARPTAGLVGAQRQGS